MKKLTKEFITSLITVILAILAIGLFISSGGSLLFYVAITLTIIIGFYNAWLISLSPATVEPAAAEAPTKQKVKRRPK